MVEKERISGGGLSELETNGKEMVRLTYVGFAGVGIRQRR